MAATELPATTFTSSEHAAFYNNNTGINGRGIATVNGTLLAASIGQFVHL